MGCDIHFWVERRVGKRWALVTPADIERRALKAAGWKGLTTKEFHKAYGGLVRARIDKVKETGTNWDAYAAERAQESFYTGGRNYHLFSHLANVRSYADTPIVPICEPRGVPEDASKGYLKQVDSWGGDGHSHSYHTLKELQAHDWASGGGTCLDFLKTLEAMAKVGPPDAVRAVFFFDN